MDSRFTVLWRRHAERSSSGARSLRTPIAPAKLEHPLEIFGVILMQLPDLPLEGTLKLGSRPLDHIIFASSLGLDELTVWANQ